MARREPTAKSVRGCRRREVEFESLLGALFILKSEYFVVGVSKAWVGCLTRWFRIPWRRRHRTGVIAVDTAIDQPSIYLVSRRIQPGIQRDDPWTGKRLGEMGRMA